MQKREHGEGDVEPTNFFDAEKTVSELPPRISDTSYSSSNDIDRLHWFDDEVAPIPVDPSRVVVAVIDSGIDYNDLTDEQ